MIRKDNLVKKIKQECVVCGIKYETYPSQKKKTCSKSCGVKYQWLHHRDRILKAREGKMKGFNGKHTEETKKKLSTKHKQNPSKTCFKNGENHPNWKGGKSFEPYPRGWKVKLRQSIRERDGKCMNCGLSRGVEKYDLAVHHIDYDKNNLCKENLIALCNSCHSKTNFNREKWEKKFIKIMGARK